MKTDDLHEVPLCERAVAILKAIVPKEAKPDDWVFKGQWGKPKPLGMNAVLHALKAVYSGPITTHGCRSTFRDWAGDETNFPREIAEWRWRTRSGTSGVGLQAWERAGEAAQAHGGLGQLTSRGRLTSSRFKHEKWYSFGPGTAVNPHEFDQTTNPRVERSNCSGRASRTGSY